MTGLAEIVLPSPLCPTSKPLGVLIISVRARRMPGHQRYVLVNLNARGGIWALTVLPHESDRITVFRGG